MFLERIAEYRINLIVTDQNQRYQCFRLEQNQLRKVVMRKNMI